MSRNQAGGTSSAGSKFNVRQFLMLRMANPDAAMRKPPTTDSSVTVSYTHLAFIRSSLTRTESRAGHFREDFPNRDESTPPYWVVLSMENGKMKTHREYLPMEEYPIKPNRFYMDQFNWS